MGLSRPCRFVADHLPVTSAFLRHRATKHSPSHSWVLFDGCVFCDGVCVGGESGRCVRGGGVGRELVWFPVFLYFFLKTLMFQEGICWNRILFPHFNLFLFFCNFFPRIFIVFVFVVDPISARKKTRRYVGYFGVHHNSFRETTPSPSQLKIATKNCRWGGGWVISIEMSQQSQKPKVCVARVSI